MSAADASQSNRVLLHAAMQWIRAVLEARIAASKPEQEHPWPWRKQREPYDAKPVQKARAEMDEAAAGSPDLPLTKMADGFGLSPFERAVLLLAVSVEIDTGMP